MTIWWRKTAPMQGRLRCNWREAINTMSFLKLFLFLVTAIVLFDAYHRYENAFPSDATTIEAVEILTESQLPEGADILWARGDFFDSSPRSWRQCAFIQLNDASYQSFLESLRTVPGYYFEPELFDCPQSKMVRALIADHDLKLVTTGAYTHHAGYAVYANADSYMVFVKLGIS